MDEEKAKEDLHRYLRSGREALLWKLEGLSEYDVRRPMVPTGTNLLGLVKHVASVELGYFGDTFDRPSDLEDMFDEADPTSDMWATVDESKQDIIDYYKAVSRHADATIEELPLDAIGHVPWWPEERREVTLHRILVHVATETDRHAGHADIVRELIDGSIGLRADNSNLPDEDAAWWRAYRDRLEATAREAADRYDGS